MFVLHKRGKVEDDKVQALEGGAISWPMKEVNLVLGCLSSVYTFVVFFLTCSLVPWMSVVYTSTHFMRLVWRRWLEKNYKNLDFITKSTARTVVDTPRNQCIISLLLTVQGNCQLELIKNRVKEEILERRSGDKLVFPHLKSLLTSCWGKYAWVKGSEKEFRLENHVVLTPSSFKGRPISDQNIRDVVSDMISKLLPSEVPPWQISVIPGAGETSYLLIRLHHLYLSEEGLTIGDILTLRQDNWDSSPVLDGVYRPPVVIPRVYAAITESTSNMWNEIVSQYDPIEKPDVVKHPSLKSCFFLMCIVAFAGIKSYFYEDKKSIWTAIETEMQKRCLSWALLQQGLFNTFSLRLIYDLIVFGIKFPFEMMKIPIRVINLALDTPVYLYWLYLGHYVIQELLYIFKVFYKAPRVLFEELCLPERPANVHQLQTISFCGRKVVSWSESVPKNVIKQICYATGATESEVLLSAVAASLRNYFLGAKFSLPENVMTTCHFTPKGKLPGMGHSGFLCLPLPMSPTSTQESLEATKKSLYSAKESQTVFYLASERGLDSSLLLGLCPILFAKAALYLLSRRYAVTISMVEGTSDCRLIWGQPVDGLMYWSPPQANVCLSMTVMIYSDSVTLGVMADAQLCPHHIDIPVHFPRYIENLASSLGIQYPNVSQD